MLKKMTIVIFSFIAFASNAKSNLKELPVPGGVKKIIINSPTEPVVEYQDKRVTVVKEGDNFVALIGIPVDTKIVTQTVWQQLPEKKAYPFKIKAKQYRLQKLTIKNKRKVTPRDEDQDRIEKEQQDFDKTIAFWRDKQTPFDKPFIAPIRGYITSTYGLKRIYNGIPKAPHTALDIAAPLGTPIKATADGRIMNIHHRFYTGNTIIIDHGQGVMSLYAHLNNVKVENGQWVKQGDLIGTVGKTGRVTGPHLHWAIYMNQTSVDPLLFINKRDILPLPKKKNKS